MQSISVPSGNLNLIIRDGSTPSSNLVGFMGIPASDLVVGSNTINLTFTAFIADNETNLIQITSTQPYGNIRIRSNIQQPGFHYINGVFSAFTTLSHSVSIVDNDPLPVELVDFEINNNKFNTLLRWATESELTIADFILSILKTV